MIGTLTFRGNHGELVCCATSGHVITATDCDCDDCSGLGDYRGIALVNIAGCDSEAVANGGGDILGAAVTYRDGRTYPAAQWVEDARGGGHYEDLDALPAPDGQPVPVYEWSAPGEGWIGIGTALEFQHWRDEGVLPDSAYLGAIKAFEPRAADEKRMACWG